MKFLAYSIAGLDLTTIIVIFVGVIVAFALLAMLINSGKYHARYKRFYKKWIKP